MEQHTGGVMNIDISNEIYQVKTEIADLKDRKDKFVLIKRAAEVAMGDAKSRVRSAGILPTREYNALINRQRQAANKIKYADSEILKVNKELRRWYAMEDELRAKSNQTAAFSDGHSGDVVKKLSALQRKYMDFAEDPTRVNSMRLMAGSFVSEIAEILTPTRPEKTP